MHDIYRPYGRNLKGFSSHDGGKTFAPEFLLPHEHEPTRKRKRSPSKSEDEYNNYDADDESPAQSCEGAVAEENARSSSDESDESNYTDGFEAYRNDEEVEQLHRNFNKAMNCDSDNSSPVSRKNLMPDFEMAASDVEENESVSASDVEENESVSIDKGC